MQFKIKTLKQCQNFLENNQYFFYKKKTKIG